MMISPEGYYESYLKGKSPEEIMKSIRSLRRTIAKLKRTMEDPLYKVTMHPSEDVQLICSKSYLSRAVLALYESGAEYTPTKAEIKADTFDEKIENIKSLDFYLGGFTGPRYNYIFSFIKDKVYCHDSYTDNEICCFERDDFIEKLRSVNVGEWKSYYNPSDYGMVICDGTQWSLEITYSDTKRIFRTGGDSIFPYNFKDLIFTLGLDSVIFNEDE